VAVTIPILPFRGAIAERADFHLCEGRSFAQIKVFLDHSFDLFFLRAVECSAGFGLRLLHGCVGFPLQRSHAQFFVLFLQTERDAVERRLIAFYLRDECRACSLPLGVGFRHAVQLDG
jgi:hypothetical protein